MDTCQVVSNAEALSVLASASKRLRSASCTLGRERRAEARWVVSKCARHISDAADPATAARVLRALEAQGHPPLTRLKLLNAKATTVVGVFLADDSVVDQAAAAEAVAKAWAEKE